MMVNDVLQDSQVPNNNNYPFKSQIKNRTLIYIYQITCKDPDVKELYIGQTETFEKRKYVHSKDSEKSNLKIYKIIRKHGGWNNWNMKILNHYYCKDEYESRQIEQKYMDVFKATMNSMRAYSKSDIDKELDRQLEFELKDFSNKILGCYLYDYYSDSDYESELDCKEELECEFCKSKLKSKNSLNSHIKNNKKCLEIQSSLVGNIVDSALISCDFCKKSFSVTNIGKHILTCKIKKKTESNNILFEYEKLQNKITKLEECNKKLQDYIIKLETENNIYKNIIKLKM